MTNEQTARKIARLAGCQFYIDGNSYTIVGLSSYYEGGSSKNPLIYEIVCYDIDGKYHEFPPELVHPLLRKIESITDEELAEIHTLCKDRLKFYGSDELDPTDLEPTIQDLQEALDVDNLWCKIVDFLRSIGIDCDNLIEQGIAVVK
jgi:hypothetical protein